MPFKDPDAMRQYQLEYMWRRRLQWILDNGPCRWCGSVDGLVVGFKNPASKTVKVSSIWSRSEENRNRILANCEVLCGQCHRKKVAIWHAVRAALNKGEDMKTQKVAPVRRPRPRKMTEAKATQLVKAIVECLECEDLEGSDRGALEDARAAISPWYDV